MKDEEPDFQIEALYRLGLSQFEACLVGMPAYSHCLVCLSGTKQDYASAWFVPEGAFFLKTNMPGYPDKPVNLDLLFFNARLSSIPLFAIEGLPTLKATYIAQIGALVSILAFEEGKNLIYKGTIRKTAAQGLGIYILRELQNKHADIYKQISDRFNDERLLKILGFIHNHLHTDLSLENLGALVFLSPDYISQYFKRCMGLSIQNYIVDQRIRSGLHQIIATQKQIAEIAQDTGFIDQAYFTRRFKAEYGLNPLKLRKNYQDLGKKP